MTVTTEPATLDISIIIPAFNEEESVKLLYDEITKALSSVNETYEVIFIDDGSSDGTYAVLKQLHSVDPSVKIIKFRRNFGQTAAISAGFDYARGEVIITMDADLQNDPADIAKLLAKMDEGYDIVSGWRADRKDPFISRKLPSMTANWLISKVSGVYLHDYGCTLKAYSRDVVKNIRLYGEMHRFIPALASWMGVRIAELPVNHRARKFGKSKYGISRTLRVVLDLLTVKFLLNFSTKPIQVFGLIGLASGALGFAMALYLAVLRLIFLQSISGRPMLLLAILLMFIGIQFVTMGLLGELMIRTYYEAQNKPIYFVKEIVS